MLTNIYQAQPIGFRVGRNQRESCPRSYMSYGMATKVPQNAQMLGYKGLAASASIKQNFWKPSGV